MLTAYRREAGVAVAILLLAVVMSAAAPGFFTAENLNDIFLANLPVLIIALGMTFLIVTGEIDISVGSVFAVCGIVAGSLAKWNLPLALVAAMIALRDALRWITQGAWVQDLPANFQWLSFTQASYPLVVTGLAGTLFLSFAWASRSVAGVRAMYATGSNPAAARLAGIDTRLMKSAAFVSVGMLTGLAALLNSARFNQIPANAGLGLEMKVIAAVVIGGTSITGGRGTVLGTLLGVILLGAIGPALTFIGVSAYWERAAQGGIILIAVALDALSGRAEAYASHLVPARA
jgi:rhamnose transport system permease protein